MTFAKRILFFLIAASAVVSSARTEDDLNYLAAAEHLFSNGHEPKLDDIAGWYAGVSIDHVKPTIKMGTMLFIYPTAKGLHSFMVMHDDPKHFDSLTLEEIEKFKSVISDADSKWPMGKGALNGKELVFNNGMMTSYVISVRVNDKGNIMFRGVFDKKPDCVGITFKKVIDYDDDGTIAQIVP